MHIDGVALPQAATSDLARRPQLDRRRFVKGMVAASLTGAAGEMAVPMAVRAARATKSSGALLGTTVDRDLDNGRFSAGDRAAGAGLEATLHVMLT
jgi:hypothetical protein